MALILNIDTAVNTASICLAKDGEPLQFLINNDQKDHAAWLHSTIQKMIAAAGFAITDLEAIAVTIGPGSYTGLRVGLSAAKGLCFALNIKLITINTLEVMANAIKEDEADFFCPLIDARRMEVFMAVYNKKMEEVIKPCALVIEADSFDELLKTGKVVFVGNGSEKLKHHIVHPNIIFNKKVITAAEMVSLSEKLFLKKTFADLAYVEPFYIKEFYSPAKH